MFHLFWHAFVPDVRARWLFVDLFQLSDVLPSHLVPSYYLVEGTLSVAQIDLLSTPTPVVLVSDQTNGYLIAVGNKQRGNNQVTDNRSRTRERKPARC